ncbi:MAG: DUF3427 domain-containing protein [Fusobacteriaceae bacterium]
MKTKLICNNNRDLLSIVKESIINSKEFYFIVSFIRFSGVQILLDVLKEAEKKGIIGKIITSNYMGITERKALNYLNKFENIEIKFYDARKIGFHPKGYIFKSDETSKIIIGSSNLSKGGLKSNIEWSSEEIVKNSSLYLENIISEFRYIWSKSYVYEQKYFSDVKFDYTKNIDYANFEISEKNVELNTVKPNYMQKKTLDNLIKLRKNNEKKALAIAATGTGKTYLAAFDVMKFKPKKMLFIAHREEIIQNAKKTFEKVILKKSTGVFTGVKKEREKEFVFATVQSLKKHLNCFDKNYFDYIVVDEAHHITSETYKTILNYLEPKFLLGLTATPERTDGEDIYRIFDNNIVMELRIKEALEEKLIVPFHYYGISDIREVDLSNLDISRIDEVAKKLMIHKRTDYIVEKLNFYGYSGERRKILGFCANIDHAKFMAEEFNKLGIKSKVLIGENTPDERKKTIEKLNYQNLEVIFTVDIFNEGVDIPNVNIILMLRPTSSAVVFIQQLGRGLRKSKGKEFLTVLDFIGNHNKTYLIALALMGNETKEKYKLKIALKNNFNYISKEIVINMDEIAKENILKQINSTNFSTLKYFKEEYETFKNISLKGRVPTYLDYLNYEGAPNILRFIKKTKTYIKFLEKIDEKIFRIDENEKKVLEEIESFLPIKRPYEYFVIKYLLNNSDISIEQAKKEILNQIESVEMESIVHCFKYLNQNFYDNNEKKRKIKLFNYDEKKNLIEKSEIFLKVLENINVKNYIEEILIYGILKYKQEFENKNYGVPFLKLYSSYSMRDVALVSNYSKFHSSYRNGINPSENKKNYYLFINLNKEELIDKEITYENTLLDTLYFYWYLKQTTSINSENGKDFLFSEQRGVNLHFFMRKFKKIDEITEPFIYLGKGIVEEYFEEKPIKTKIRLENKMKERIYLEFVRK